MLGRGPEGHAVLRRQLTLHDRDPVLRSAHAGIEDRHRRSVRRPGQHQAVVDHREIVQGLHAQPHQELRLGRVGHVVGGAVRGERIIEGERQRRPRDRKGGGVSRREVVAAPRILGGVVEMEIELSARQLFRLFRREVGHRDILVADPPDIDPEQLLEGGGDAEEVAVRHRASASGPRKASAGSATIRGRR